MDVKPLTAESKQQLLDIVTKMFQKDEPARVVMIRPPIRTTQPNNEWGTNRITNGETYDSGKTLYMLIAVGDESPDEQTIRDILENRIRQEGL